MPYYYRRRRTYNAFTTECCHCGRRLLPYEGKLLYRRGNGTWAVECRDHCSHYVPAPVVEAPRPTVVGACDVVEPDGSVTMGYLLTDGSVMKSHR